METILGLVAELKPVSLKELDAVSLLNRIDTKYTLPRYQFKELQEWLKEHYRILQIDDKRVFKYENNYFDTPDFQFFRDHHNGYANRMKVRCRKYVDSNKCFFEVKRKEKVNRTNKFRRVIEKMPNQLSTDLVAKVTDISTKELGDMHLSLKNSFERITLVNNNFTERVTIDFNISYALEEDTSNLPEIIIVEVKQSKSNDQSPITHFFKSRSIQPQSFSKYVFGVMSLYPEVKKNNFLPILRHINKLKELQNAYN